MTPPDLPEHLSGDSDHDRIARATESMPPPADIADLADVFGLLGESTRVKILIALLTGPLRVGDLASIVGMSESATSHALRLLRAHRVVDVHRHGRTAVYDLSDTHVRTLLELGLDHVGHTVLLHVAAGEHDEALEQPTTDCRVRHP